jgi:hypothetical protein
VADPIIDLLCERLVELRNEQAVLIRSSRKLLTSGAPYPLHLVADRLDAMHQQACLIAGDLYRAGATDAAFDAVCGWTLNPVTL